MERHRDQHALKTRDRARSRIEAELVEQRVERGGLATRTDQMPIVKELGELIDAVQEFRVPLEQLSGVEDGIAHALKAVANADVLRVLPINESHPANEPALKAFEAETGGAYAEALAAAQER